MTGGGHHIPLRVPGRVLVQVGLALAQVRVPAPQVLGVAGQGREQVQAQVQAGEEAPAGHLVHRLAAASLRLLQVCKYCNQDCLNCNS